MCSCLLPREPFGLGMLPLQTQQEWTRHEQLSTQLGDLIKHPHCAGSGRGRRCWARLLPTLRP